MFESPLVYYSLYYNFKKKYLIAGKRWCQSRLSYPLIHLNYEFIYYGLNSLLYHVISPLSEFSLLLFHFTLFHTNDFIFRGHSPEWYKKVYGHICANFMDRIRASFHCDSDGPETKV